MLNLNDERYIDNQAYLDQVLFQFTRGFTSYDMTKYTSFEGGGDRKPISKTERKKRNKKNKQASKQRKRNGKK